MNRSGLLFALLAIACTTFAQVQPSGSDANNASSAPALMFQETEHDFGTISEQGGNAKHVFHFKNTGTAPLTVTQVTATCGCTQPEWTRTPIEPGQEGSITVVYSTKGRLGPFNKYATVFTNEDNRHKRHRITIKGDVIQKPLDPVVAYIDSIGGVGIEETHIRFKTLEAGTNSNVVHVKNSNAEAVYFSLDNVPEYITVTCPDSLKADWPGEISIVIDGAKTADKRGRITDSFLLTVKDRDGKTLGSETITATANYTDNFKDMTTLQRVNAPALEIDNAIIDFGVVKKGLFGLKSTAKREALFTNAGKADMTVHSISSDDPRVQISFRKNIIRPGESLPVNVAVKAQETIDADIYIICNDPKGPVRLVKVTAQKALATPASSTASTATAE